MVRKTFSAVPRGGTDEDDEPYVKETRITLRKLKSRIDFTLGSSTERPGGPVRDGAM